jgi:hypothetical protein
MHEVAYLLPPFEAILSSRVIITTECTEATENPVIFPDLSVKIRVIRGKYRRDYILL